MNGKVKSKDLIDEEMQVIKEAERHLVGFFKNT